MKNIALILALAAAAVVRAGAEPPSLPDAFAGAEGAVKAARVRDFHLASNDSNSPEIYRALAAAGAKTSCVSEAVDEGGLRKVRQSCDAVETLDRVTVKRNEIVWRSTQIVEVQGAVHCWQEWLSTGGVYHRPRNLWHFCDFRGTVEPGP